jgi:type I restriction enzyme S subunit
LRISIPGVDVQKKIAAILSTYDSLLENNRRRIQLLEQSARLLYREWFVNLRFPGHEHVRIIDGVPEGWEKETITSLGQVITGKTPSTKEEDNYGSDIPFIKTPDMHGMPVVIETEQSLSEKGANTQVNKFIPKGSIMVSCIGTVGVVSLNGCKAQTNQQINTVIPRKDCLRYYSYFALSDLKPKLEALGGGATMPNINKTKFESLQVVVPSDSVLNIFDDFCQQAFKQIKNVLEQNQKLKEARDLLLPRLMNGEITV